MPIADAARLERRIALVVFALVGAVLVATGVVLTWYYRPTANVGFADLRYLEFDVPFGMVMRNLHRVATHALVVAVWLHLAALVGLRIAARIEGTPRPRLRWPSRRGLFPAAWSPRFRG